MFYLRDGVRDLEKGLPVGARGGFLHTRNEHLQGYQTEAGSVGYYCVLCGFRPARLGGPKGAVAKHRHTRVCSVCTAVVHRTLCSTPWMHCVPCARAAVAARFALVAVAKPCEPAAPSGCVCVGGMWADRGGGPRHSDTARYVELRRILAPSVGLYGVSNGPLVSTDTTLLADLRAPRCWFSDKMRGDNDSIARRLATVFILDYFWAPPIYFAVGEHGPNGYGAGWFSVHLPTFFTHGGVVALLPNDVQGHVLRMHAGAPSSGLQVSLLSLADAGTYNPLYCATDFITDVDLKVLRGVPSSHGGSRTNDAAVRDYLDPMKPFILVHRIPLVDALEYLQSLLKLV
jgi:hypothetical protein